METNKIDISIITPVYNGEKYLNKLVDNIAQLNKDINYEIIFINDCSKDNSKTICESLIQMHNNIKLINNDSNIGIAESRNKGLKASRGKYITFVDQDDYLNKGYSFFTNLLENNDADFLYSNYYVSKNNKETNILVNKNDRLCKKEELIKLERFLFNSQTFPINDNYSIKSSIWNCVFKKDLIDKNNLKFFRYTSYEDDWLFLIEALKKSNKVYLSKESYYCWVIRKNTESHKNKYIDNYFEKSLKLLDYAIKSLKDTGLSNAELKEYILYSNKTILLWCFYNECENKSNIKNNEKINALINYYEKDIKKFINISNSIDKLMLSLILHRHYNLAKFIQLKLIKIKYL